MFEYYFVYLVNSTTATYYNRFYFLQLFKTSLCLFFIENNKNGFSDTSHERCHNKPKHVAQHHHNRHGEPNPRSKSDSTAQTSKPHEASMKRSSSCSALPSSIKPLDRHNPRIPAHEIQNRLCAQRNPDEIEAKENAILEQCYRNEGISSNCVEQHCSYVVDCIHGKPSKFPLPERLNYPLNKYYKSDTNLNRLSININLQHPIKKIRSSIRKLKSRSPSSTVLSTPERYEHYSRTTSSNSINDTLDSMDSSYLNYLTESENSEAIMARLASKPSSRKAWVKKVFKWKKLGKLGKTYTPKNDTEKSKNSESIIYSESPSKSLNTRSHSTRSIPDAIKHMWTKLHDVPVHMTEPEPPTTPNLTRASSMPSIASHRISKQKIGDVIYFHEKGFEQNENKNIFQNFFKPMDAQPPKLTSLKGGNDVITSVLGGYEHVSVKNSLADAELSHGKEDLSSRENENNNQASGGKSAVQHYYTSCQDLREHHTPVPYASPAPYSSAGHCPCCGHSQFPHTEQYMDRADMYDSQYQHYQYQNSGHQPVAYYSRSSAPPAVIAPLDVKVSSERKAERRKICEMVFDTFV